MTWLLVKLGLNLVKTPWVCGTRGRFEPTSAIVRPERTQSRSNRVNSSLERASNGSQLVGLGPNWVKLGLEVVTVHGFGDGSMPF